MADVTISRERLLELLGEAYQAGCYGYLELMETECAKILHENIPEDELCKGILPDELKLQPSTVTVNPYSWPGQGSIDLGYQEYAIQRQAVMQSDHLQMTTGSGSAWQTSGDGVSIGSGSGSGAGFTYDSGEYYTSIHRGGINVNIESNKESSG